MAKVKRRAKERNIFQELMSGVDAVRVHCEGRPTLRTYGTEPGPSPR